MRRVLAAYLALLAALAALAAAGGVYLFRETGPSDAIEAAADAPAYNVTRREARSPPGGGPRGLPWARRPSRTWTSSFRRWTSSWTRRRECSPSHRATVS